MDKSTKELVIATVVVLAVIVVLAVTLRPQGLLKNKNGESIFQAAPVSVEAPAQPTDFGNGVYYFKTEGKNFGAAVSLFLSTHNCKVEGMASHNASGNTEGYFVVCR